MKKVLRIPTIGGDIFADYKSNSGTIVIKCQSAGDRQYLSASTDIIINWKITSITDTINPIVLPIMYTGDDPVLYPVFIDTILDSDKNDKTKQQKTITVSDNRILKITQYETNNYRLESPKVDVSNPEIMKAIKNAAITISTPGNRYYLPFKQVIPVKLYPNNSRLANTPAKRLAYITSGASHYLGIDSNGRLLAWGTYNKSVFASSNTVDYYGPVSNQFPVNIINHPNNKRWIQVESYGYNVLALDIDGELS